MGKITDELKNTCADMDTATFNHGFEDLLDCLMGDTEQLIADTLEELPPEDHEEARSAILELKRENLH